MDDLISIMLMLALALALFVVVWKAATNDF